MCLFCVENIKKIKGSIGLQQMMSCLTVMEIHKP